MAPRLRKHDHCQQHLTNGKVCGRDVLAGHSMCRLHVTVEIRRREQRNAEEVWMNVLETLWTIRNPEQARQEFVDAIEDERITLKFRDRYSFRFQNELELFYEIFPPPPVQPIGELHALVLDSQNVHTKAVNDQTNDGLALLLSDSSDQNTLIEIRNEWDEKPENELKQVLKDMKKWYVVKTCRETNDCLYKRTLDSLWNKIQSSDMKTELSQRLWEECLESVGLCCDGHITRLCNVMVGFDEAFLPPVLTGVILQEKMAMISQKDIDVHYKVGEAWAVFEELKIPMEERKAWIEAF